MPDQLVVARRDGYSLGIVFHRLSATRISAPLWHILQAEKNRHLIHAEIVVGNDFLYGILVDCDLIGLARKGPFLRAAPLLFPFSPPLLGLVPHILQSDEPSPCVPG